MVKKCEEEKNRLLHIQEQEYKKKISLEKRSALHLERLVDKCKNGICAGKLKRTEKQCNSLQQPSPV